MVVDFELEGQQFVALNGGPQFKFTEAISFVVNCETQKEVDYFWGKLLAGGQESQIRIVVANRPHRPERHASGS